MEHEIPEARKKLLDEVYLVLRFHRKATVSFTDKGILVRLASGQELFFEEKKIEGADSASPEAPP